jgi:hypothetical protein
MKVFLIILCVLLGLAGLFMSACGGLFTMMTLTNSNGDALGILAISLPFVAVGAACIWGAVAGLRRATRKPSPEQAQRQSPGP